MKASAVLVLAGALLVAASPIEKRVLKTKYVTDITYVTVTVDGHAVSMMRPGNHEHKTKSSVSSSAPTTSSTLTTPTTLSTKISSATPTSTSTSTTTPPAPTTSSTTSTTPVPTPAPAPTTSSTTTVAPVEVAATTVEAAATTAETTTAAAATTTAAATTKAATTTAAAAKTTTAAAASTPSDFSSTAVYHHNLHRANHSAPDIAWNSDLASYAATVAAKCVFAHDLTPGASTGSYGQNIATYGTSGNIEDISESEAIAESITNMWYNGEVNKYPAYGEATPDMTNFESWGHFSQLVWVASTEVGCAVSYCDAGTIFSGMASWFSVCNYRSAGNVGGSYGTNVLAPLGKATVKA